MEKTATSKIKLGFFVTVGTIIFILSMYFIGEKQNMFGGTFHVNAIFNNVSGLKKGNNVRLSGIDVGTVKSIEILSDTSIKVDMVIDKKVKKFIKKDALATIGTDGLMGDNLVNISPGSSTAGIIGENEILPTLKVLNADEMLRRLEQTNDNITVITNSLVEIFEKINQGEGTIGKLLMDTSLADDVGQMLQSMKVLSDKSVNISKMIEENVRHIDHGNNTIGMLLKDTVFAVTLGQTADEIMTASKNLENMTIELNDMIKNVKQGEGAVGTLLADSVFSNNLKQSLNSIQQGAKDFSENMEALKYNFLFRRYFKKKEKVDSRKNIRQLE